MAARKSQSVLDSSNKCPGFYYLSSSKVKTQVVARHQATTKIEHGPQFYL